MENELVALGRNIRKARKILNISQEELAFRCELHRTYLSDIERGVRNLSFSSLVALAKGLGSTVSELTQDISNHLDRVGQPGSAFFKKAHSKANANG
jgi:transcriptional regulator with XRE-family HTH domain